MEAWLLGGHCQAKSRSSPLSPNMELILSSHLAVEWMAFSHIFHQWHIPSLISKHYAISESANFSAHKSVGCVM